MTAQPTITPEALPQASMYSEQTGAADSERRRLRTMALIGDEVSLHVLFGSSTSGIDGTTVIDVGCGDGLGLSSAVRARGGSILSTDKRPDAVQAQQHAGEAIIAEAQTLEGVPNDTFDAYHSRYTYGWLGNSTRQQALARAIEVTKVGGNVTIIDYDWSVAEGPECVMSLRDAMLDILDRLGNFDGSFGAKIEDGEISQLLAKVGVTNQTAEPNVDINRHSVYHGAIRDALPLIEENARPLIDTLEENGQTELAEQLTALLNGVKGYATFRPEESVRIPEIVSSRFTVTADMKERLARPDIRARVGMVGLDELLVDGRDYQVVFPAVPGMNNIVLATSDKAVLSGRRAQAAAYKGHGHVTSEAIDDDNGGVLNQHIDPQGLVDRSRYVLCQTENGTEAVVRMVLPTDEGVGSLPTYTKLSGSGNDNITNLLLQHPMSDPGAKVFEVSALGKSPDCNDPLASPKTVLALSEIARREGYEFALMGVVSSSVGSIKKIFGNKALERFDGDEATMGIATKGVGEHVELVPYIVNVQTFMADVAEHAAAEIRRITNKQELTKADRMFLPIYQELHRLSTSIINNRSK